MQYFVKAAAGMVSHGNIACMYNVLGVLVHRSKGSSDMKNPATRVSMSYVALHI